MTGWLPAADAGQVQPTQQQSQLKEDVFTVIRYTSYWILYGFLALVVVSSLVAAIKGATS